MTVKEESLDARKVREKSFHDDRFAGGDQVREAATKYYSIMETTTRAHFRKLVLARAKGARLLEYGCGPGSNSALWANGGAKVTGIDISTSAIELARADESVTGLDIDFREMDAEYLQFEDQTFDLVVGTCILHHLDLNRAYSELRRVLKPTGHAIFIEPLGHNPLINLYRRLTPNMRTVDEHPLRAADIEQGREYFESVEVAYSHICSLAAVPFRRAPGFQYLVGGLCALDSTIMYCLPFMRKYAWMSVIDYSRPSH